MCVCVCGFVTGLEKYFSHRNMPASPTPPPPPPITATPPRSEIDPLTPVPTLIGLSPQWLSGSLSPQPSTQERKPSTIPFPGPIAATTTISVSV